MLFDDYLFADYSGAFDTRGQRKAIRLARATAEASAEIVGLRLTRSDLVREFVDRLEVATQSGRRVCFGQDHQYGIPFGLAAEIGLSDHRWRELVDSLATGSYGPGAPALGHPKEFARVFNAWLVARGGKPYFYSATKSALYGLPRQNPRSGDVACYRLTELRRSESGVGAPKAFNRVGDNGTVGGQSLVGILAIRRLLVECAARHLRVAVWPFDGFSIHDEVYRKAHVMMEPYPSAVRAAGVAQSDDSDAMACADHVRQSDRSGALEDLMDLTALGTKDTRVVATEGWILSHRAG